MKLIIGIDPGQGKTTHGGIAVLKSDGSVFDVWQMPDTMSEVYELLKEVVNGGNTVYDGCVCYLEDVGHGMPGQSSSATAKFARHCGHLEMAMYALEVKTVTCTPQKWQKMYQIAKGGEYRDRKKALRAKAQQLFPQLGKRVNDSTSDCLLIAEYGRKQEVKG